MLGAQQALADEVEHARLAFGLASLYLGTGVGPGALMTTGAGAATDLPALVDAVIREACLGETLAAFEAREAAERAEDPAVQAALRKIAGDERRHAELGWRFVQWALSGADATAQARARATFAAALADAGRRAGRRRGRRARAARARCHRRPAARADLDARSRRGDRALRRGPAEASGCVSGSPRSAGRQ